MLATPCVGSAPLGRYRLSTRQRSRETRDTANAEEQFPACHVKEILCAWQVQDSAETGQSGGDGGRVLTSK